MSKNLEGKWINASTLRPFGSLDIIEFKNDKIEYSLLENTEGELVVKENKNPTHFAYLSNLKFEFINPNRIRFYVKGKRIKIINETESVTEDSISEIDYVKLIPTRTKILESRIQTLKYHFVWNNEKQIIEFNKIKDQPEILEALKNINYKGWKFVLEKIDQTLLISSFYNNERGLVMPVKEIDETKAILFGLPIEPYETIAKRIV